MMAQAILLGGEAGVFMTSKVGREINFEVTLKWKKDKG